MLASMAEREKNRRKASMKSEELKLPPFGRLWSLEQPPVWLRPHKGEQISICDGGQSQGWVLIKKRGQLPFLRRFWTTFYTKQAKPTPNI